MYGIKYIGEWRDKRGGLSRFEISQRDYAGDMEQMVMQADPLTIERSVMDNKFQPSVGSGLELNVEAEYDGQYLNTYTSDIKKYKAKFSKNGDVIWLGYLNTEVYSEDYTRLAGYPVQLNFNDGFAVLERLLFVDNNGVNYSGLKSAWDVLWIILDKLGLDYKYIYVGCDSYHEGMDRSQSPLHQFKVNCDNYYDEQGDAMNCREVLDAILLTQRAICYQNEGTFNIVSVPLLAEGAYQCIRYASVDDPGETIVVNDTVNVPQNADWYSDDQQIDVVAARNKAVVKYSPYGFKTILNSDFNDNSRWIGEGVWTVFDNRRKLTLQEIDSMRGTQSSRPVGSYTLPKFANMGTLFYKLEGISGIEGWSNAEDVTVSGVKSDLYSKETIYFNVPFSEGVTTEQAFSNDTSAVVNGVKNCGYKFSFKCYIETKENEFDETEEENIVRGIVGDVDIYIGGVRIDSYNVSGDSSNRSDYGAVSYYIGSDDESSIADKWHTVVVDIPCVDAHGDVKVVFFKGFGTRGENNKDSVAEGVIKSVRFSDIKIEAEKLILYKNFEGYTPDDEEDDTDDSGTRKGGKRRSDSPAVTPGGHLYYIDDLDFDDVEFVAEMKDSWADEFESVEMIHGDSFDLSPTDRGALYTLANSLTYKWQTFIDTDKYYNIAELLLRSIVSNYRRELKQLSGTLSAVNVLNSDGNRRYGVLNFNSVITLSDQYLTGKRLMFMGGTYNDAACTINGTWLEVLKDELVINN